MPSNIGPAGFFACNAQDSPQAVFASSSVAQACHADKIMIPVHVVAHVALAPNGELTMSASRLDKFAGRVSDSPD